MKLKKSKLLPQEYYQNEDVVFLSKDLLGKYLFTCIDGEITGGMIIETEAYCGPEDRASHAHRGRRTNRNEVMYWEGGISYVYQCYGIHSLLNVVTNSKEIPHAILIRAIKPIWGIEVMLKRRHKHKLDKTVAGGPGTLTQALGITRAYNGLPLTGPQIWIEDGLVIPENEIISGPRVGIDYAGEDAHKPWRFRIKNSI